MSEGGGEVAEVLRDRAEGEQPALPPGEFGGRGHQFGRKAVHHRRVVECDGDDGVETGADSWSRVAR